jgi:hypothetical protein
MSTEASLIIKDTKFKITITAEQISELMSSESTIRAKPLDRNGVALLYNSITGGRESYSPQIDERDDGWRFNFQGDYAPAMDLGGYFKINRQNNEEEISFKIFGGDHDRDNPKLSRCYDIGIRFDGGRIRSRTEHEHNGRGGGPYSSTIDKTSIRIGNLVDRWVGFRFIGYNFEEGNKKKQGFQYTLIMKDLMIRVTQLTIG